MVQRIEMLGVDTPQSAGRAPLPGPDRSRSTMVVLLGLAIVVVVALARPGGGEEGVVVDDTAPDASDSSERLIERPGSRWTASSVVPVAERAGGITLILGRGVEKVFVRLDTGERHVVDLDGVPTAFVDEFVRLTDGEIERWYDMDRRFVIDGPLTVDAVVGGAFPDDAGTGGGPTVDEAGLVIVVPSGPDGLAAASVDGRWSAGWRAGQPVVTDLVDGTEYVVPDVRRTYFDDSVSLVG